jgi:hypothetical protein
VTHDRTPRDARRDGSEDPPPARLRGRAALDEVFGDVLPEVTRDDRAEPGADSTGSRRGDAEARDEDLRRDVPPHHV